MVVSRNHEGSETEPGDPPTTVIVGATGGVGSALARAYADHDLILLGREGPKLERLRSSYPTAQCVAVDFADERSVSEALQDVARIDHLIQAAGTIVASPLQDAERSDWLAMLEANLLTPLTTTKTALPALRAAHGTIVFISSGSARRVKSGWAGYSASKAACESLAQGLRLEEPDVRVLSVFAGSISTPMREKLGETAGADYDVDDYLTTEDIVRAVLFALGQEGNAAIQEIVIRPK